MNSDDSFSYSDDEGSYLYEQDEGSYLYEQDDVMDEMPSTSKVPPMPTIRCNDCDAVFGRKDNLDRHICIAHEKDPELVKGDFTCKKC